MKRYAFYSRLSPEKFLKELYEQTEKETMELNQWHGESVEAEQWKAAWKFEWDGDVMTLNCTRSTRVKGQGTRVSGAMTGLSFFVGKWSSWNTSWGEPFRGRIEADEKGGSALLGRFHMLSGSIFTMILLSAIVLVYLINGWDNSSAIWTGVAAETALIVWFIRNVRQIGENPLSQETLEFLKRHSERWEII